MLSEAKHRSDWLKAGFVALLLPVVLVACAGRPDFMHRAPTAPPSTDTFKVLTYNALHGLEVDRFWVSPGESAEQRAARFGLRIRQLVETKPDLILLQEVNPLPAMAEDYVQALKAFDLDYSEVHQVDACGLRVPGLALLPELNNGLVILAKAPLGIRKLEGLKLSGPIGGCRDSIGLQFGEFRYALIAEVTAPATGMQYLVATMHLHSGIERDAKVLQDLMEAQSQGRLHRYEQLMIELKRDEERRRMELQKLMDALQRYQHKEAYAGVIFGGDLNFEIGSPEYQELERHSFQDTAHLAAGMPMWNTYDPQNNPLAGHEEEALPSELTSAIAGESPSDQQQIVTAYRRAIHMARRIDFLFSMAFMSNACLRQDLFGKPTSMDGPAGSDHYGVLNTYSYQRLPC